MERLKTRIESFDEKALLLALAESQGTRLTQDLVVETIKEQLPTVEAMRKCLLEEIETNVIAQAAATYVNVFLNSDLVGNSLISDGINYIEDALNLTNSPSQFDENHNQVKALYLNENGLYDEAWSLAEDYLGGYDEDALEEEGLDAEFSPDELMDQLMIFMIFYKSGPLSYDETIALQMKLLRGE